CDLIEQGNGLLTAVVAQRNRGARDLGGGGRGAGGILAQRGEILRSCLDLACLELIERGDQSLRPLLQGSFALVLPEQVAAKRRKSQHQPPRDQQTITLRYGAELVLPNRFVHLAPEHFLLSRAAGRQRVGGELV